MADQGAPLPTVMSSPLRDAIGAFLDETEQEALSAQRGHKRNDGLATQLALAATVLAAVATLTALPEGIANGITAGTAFAAAILSGISTTLKPQERAQKFQEKYVEWTELHNGARRLLRLMDQFDHREQQGERPSMGPKPRRFDEAFVHLERQRDNLRRAAVGLDPLPEPPASSVSVPASA